MSATAIILPGSRPPKGWTYERQHYPEKLSWKHRMLLEKLWFFKLMFFCGFIKFYVVSLYERKDVDYFDGALLSFEILQFFFRNPLLVPECFEPEIDEPKRCIFFMADRLNSPEDEVYFPYLRVFNLRRGDWWKRKRNRYCENDYMVVVR